MKRITFVCIIFFSSLPAFAANYYVTPSGSGAANGSDFSNALPWSFTPARGDGTNIYYLAGGNYATGKTLSAAASGTNIITIRKATAGAQSGVAGWDAAYDNQAVINGNISITTSYWTIDGVSRATDTTGYGIKIVAPGGANSRGITMASGQTHNNLIFQYLEIAGAVVPITDAALDANTATQTGIYNYGNNIMANYCYIHDVSVMFHNLGGTGIVLDGNYFYRNASTATHHAEALSATGGSFTIKNNKLGNIEGTAYLAFMNGGTVTSADIYNNIFFTDGTQAAEGVGNGTITCTNSGTVCNNFNILNNTAVNIVGIASHFDVGSGATISAWNDKNNLHFCNLGASCAPSNSDTTAGITYSKNWYGGLTYRAAETDSINGSTEDPFTNSATFDFSLANGSTPVDAGANTAATVTTDIIGTIRPQGSAVDIGAYERQGTPLTNGVCGTADGVPVAVAPSTNLCTTGVESAVTGSLADGFEWTCGGIGGGTSDFCSTPALAVSANKTAGRYTATQTVTLSGNADHFLYCYGLSTCTLATTYTVPITTILMNYDGTPKYLRIQAVDGVGGTSAITTIGPLKKQRVR